MSWADGEQRESLAPQWVCADCRRVWLGSMRRCPFCRRARRAKRRTQARRSNNYRKRITRAKRRRVFARDGHQCLRCLTTADLTLDHIVPISQGGTNAEDNLQTLCRRCNGAKASKNTIDHRPSVPPPS